MCEFMSDSELNFHQNIGYTVDIHNGRYVVHIIKAVI